MFRLSVRIIFGLTLASRIVLTSSILSVSALECTSILLSVNLCMYTIRVLVICGNDSVSG